MTFPGNIDFIPHYVASNAVFTPDCPLRLTQSNLWRQLERNSNFEDSTYGAHFTEYGGVGKAKLNPKYANVPRKHMHFKCGADIPIPPPVTDLNRKFLVNRNKGFFAQPLNQMGYQMKAVSDKYNRPFRIANPVKLSLFPRSVVYELEFIKNEYRQKMLHALEIERKAFAEKKRKKIMNTGDQEKVAVPTEEIQKNDDMLKQRVAEPPFWYENPPGSRHLQQESPVGSINDCHTRKFFTMPPKVDFIKELHLHSPDNYIPGEVYKKKKDPIEILTSESSCVSKPSIAETHFDPSTVPEKNELCSRVYSRGESYAEEEESEECKSCCFPTGCVHKRDAKSKDPCDHVLPLNQHQEFPYPGEPVRFLPWNEKRQDELFQVGYPFRTLAARWMKENVDPIRPSTIMKSAKKRFPEMSFSNL
ncbi:uncharacterized protein LOC106673952 isoform X2 [Cimex lectularius]|uniref:Uncharacterized protein n=1 Tax=Cimex lectularius TaxID=79782 RepID=A0A8I6SQ40_CIMLE|nr:uncharacterized protein LOC106673952 isoform X2 [Cimex lectularius]